jgi:hypothetical protein
MASASKPGASSASAPAARCGAAPASAAPTLFAAARQETDPAAGRVGNQVGQILDQGVVRVRLGERAEQHQPELLRAGGPQLCGNRLVELRRLRLADELGGCTVSARAEGAGDAGELPQQTPGAGSELRRRMRQFELIGVDHGNRGAVECGLADAMGQQRLFLPEVAADDQQAALLLQLGDGQAEPGHAGSARSPRKSCWRRRVSMCRPPIARSRRCAR